MTRTNVYTLLTVLIRAAALLVLVSFAANLVLSIATWMPVSAAEEGVDWMLIGMIVLTLGVSSALWLFADVLARLALARPDGQVFDSDIDAQQWQSIAFSTVGLWALVYYGLGALRSLLFVIAMRNEGEGSLVGQRHDFVAGLVGDAIGSLLGIALLLGARGLVALLHRLRYGSQAP
jgi:hypothetical protein